MTTGKTLNRKPDAGNPHGRLESLDALRGFDMLLISGLGMTIIGFCKLFPGGSLNWLADQFRHVNWDGLVLWDTVFPLFVFIAGVSFPFSLSRQRERGDSVWRIHGRILRRLAALLLLGMVYNGVLQLNFKDFRYASVLGKIGMAWAFAALLYTHFGIRARICIVLAMLAGYWALLTVTAPDAPPGCGPWTLKGCFPGYLDRIGFTPGHLYEKNILEPSGAPVSILGSSVTASLGMLAGDLLRSARENLTPARKAMLLAATGVVLLLAGWCCVLFGCPVIKKLWTPSFTLLAGGYSFLMLALFYWIIDVKGCRRWCRFLEVVGLNAVTVYMFKRIVNCSALSKFFFGGVARFFPNPEFMVGLGVLLICWGLCWFLDRQRIYLKV